MTQKAQTLTINRYWDGLLVFIAISAICVVGFRLYVTEWTEHLDILVYISFFAGVAGLVLGYSRFSAPVAALFSTLYGTFIIGWLMGTTVSIEMSWRNRILNYLGLRLKMALYRFRLDQPINDPILFLMLMALILWILGTIASFVLIRKGRVWQLILPFGVALLVVGHYDQNQAMNAGYLFAFLLFFLILVGRMTFLHYRKNWRREGIITNAGARADLSKALFLLSIALLGLAWLIPVTSGQINTSIKIWNTITAQWDRFSERVEEVFTFESGMSRSAPEIFYRNDLFLGVGSEPGSDPVFTVEALSNVPVGYRPYWRTRSYDTYDEGAWSSSLDEREEMLFPENFEIAYPDWEGSRTASYRFTTQVTLTDVIYAPGSPIWVDRPVQAKIVPLQEAEEDLVGLVADPPMAEGDRYEVQTVISLPTIAELRETGMDYPEWTDAYLQLPEDFPPEIEALTLEMLSGQDNPYEMTARVTQYLRDNITYAAIIDPIPAGEDPIAWFLFESQEGFCNYFATAQVLMLRSMGIPARLSVGYAQGTYDAVTSTYNVLAFNSHAWPEVYFENYGWVIFEPTVSEDNYVLPAQRPQNSNAFDPNVGYLPMMDMDFEITPESDRLNGLPGETLLPDGSPAGDDLTGELTLPEESSTDLEESQAPRGLWLIPVSLVILVTILIRKKRIRINFSGVPIFLEKLLKKLDIKVPVWLGRWSKIAQMPAFEKAYRQLSQSLKLMGHPLSTAETPAERAQALSQLLPQVSTPAQTIAHDYYLNKYSRGDDIPDEKRARFAAFQVKRVTRRTWWQRITHFWQKTTS